MKLEKTIYKIFFAATFIMLSAPSAVWAATLYRSVGNTTSDLNTTPRTVTVSGTTATFSGAMPDNVGVGDVLQYQVAATYYVAFISGRTSSSVYTVQDQTGGTPQAASAGTAVSVYRAHTGLDNWEDQVVGDVNTSIHDNVDDLVLLNSTNLVTDTDALFVACYADADDVGEAVSIDGWTTDATYYIKVYTPTDTSEVGTSQRHDGTEGTGFVFAPTVSFGTGNNTMYAVADSYVRTIGLEINGQNITNGDDLIAVNLSSAAVSAIFSHNLVYDITNSTTHAQTGSARGIRVNGSTVYISNNIIYNVTNISAQSSSYAVGMEEVGGSSTIYAYNNTIMDIKNTATGNAFGAEDGGTFIMKNNYIGDVVATSGSEVCFDPGLSSGSTDNVSSDATGDDGNLANGIIDQSDYASYFVSVGSDFHLLDDANALWGSYGADLDGDANLAVTDDIDGEARDATQPDVGADEFVGSSGPLKGAVILID